MKRHSRDAQPAHGAPAAVRPGSFGGTLADRLDASPRQAAQRAQMEAAMAPSPAPVQRFLDDEAPTQMALQRVAEDGGSSAVTQRAMEEDDTAQLRSAPTQASGESASSAPGGLPPNLQSGVEALSGMDMSGVQVHYNSPAPAQVNALAYAQGPDIHLASGQEHHLAHEAWHVVQQMQGRVQPTTQMGDTQINDSPALEAEADRMGSLAQRHRP
ncbi:MAG: DUF4157 domain-containing protein [Pseudomonadota bacterium]